MRRYLVTTTTDKTTRFRPVPRAYRQGTNVSRSTPFCRRYLSSNVPMGPTPRPPNNEERIWKPLMKAVAGTIAVIVGGRFFFLVVRGAAASSVLLTPVGVGLGAFGVVALLAGYRTGFITLNRLSRVGPYIAVASIGTAIACMIVRDSCANMTQGIVLEAMEILRQSVAANAEGGVWHLQSRSSPLAISQKGDVGIDRSRHEAMEIVMQVRHSTIAGVKRRTLRVVATRPHFLGAWSLGSVILENPNGDDDEGAVLLFRAGARDRGQRCDGRC